jgi:hypothetical protein
MLLIPLVRERAKNLSQKISGFGFARSRMAPVMSGVSGYTVLDGPADLSVGEKSAGDLSVSAGLIYEHPRTSIRQRHVQARDSAKHLSGAV